MKITERSSENTIMVKTMTNSKKEIPSDWWNSNSKKEICDKFIGTVSFLKKNNEQRYRQAGIYARLYGNLPIQGWMGSNASRMSTDNMLPMDRPTMSIVTSCVDTIHSKISQSRPRPIFLTDNGDYKQRKLSSRLNNFIAGELYQTHAYEQMPLILRDASVIGTGCLKILENQNKRVSIERRLCTDLLIDQNDAFYGEPRQLYELKLVDRAVLAEMFPKYRSDISKAEQGYPDNSADSSKSVSDLVMVAEGWRLPNGPGTPGMHVIACTEGVLMEESWEEDWFPFTFLHYVPRMIGFWGQGIPERLMGTQIGINQLLMTIHKSINLVGVPRVFVEDGSKVVKAHLNNDIGAIVTYRGTKPQYEVAPCVPVELYQQLERLIQFGYKQEGISELIAGGVKPAGLDSGEAQREFQNIQSDRFAALNKRYDDAFVDLSYKIINLAKGIANRDGKYETVYPNKDTAREVELPKCDILENEFVIQCFNSSSLPRDPSGRLQKVTEMMQAGIISPQEGRRLLDYPDIEQVDKLANAGEERILEILDLIVEDGKFTPPDEFMDLALAETLVTQYYNLYEQAKLEEEKAQMLRDFYTQIQGMKQQALIASQPQMAPQANPEPAPTSDLIPNMPGGGIQ